MFCFYSSDSEGITTCANTNKWGFQRNFINADKKSPFSDSCKLCILNFANYNTMFNSLSHKIAVDVYPGFKTYTVGALKEFIIKVFQKCSFLR